MLNFKLSIEGKLIAFMRCSVAHRLLWFHLNTPIACPSHTKSHDHSLLSSSTPIKHMKCEMKLTIAAATPAPTAVGRLACIDMCLWFELYWQWRIELIRMGSSVQFDAMRYDTMRFDSATIRDMDVVRVFYYMTCQYHFKLLQTVHFIMCVKMC